MTAVETAAWGGLVVSACTLLFAVYAARRKEKTSDSRADSLDSRFVAATFKEERDALRAQLEEVTREYEKRLADMTAHYEARLAEASRRHEAQMADMRAETEILYRRLVGPPPPAADR